MSAKETAVKLFDNKQLVHIVAEGVVMFGIVLYFSSKNRKLQGDIEAMAQRMEDQEDRIEKLENTIQSMTAMIQRLNEGLTNVSRTAQESYVNLSQRLEPRKAPAPLRVRQTNRLPVQVQPKEEEKVPPPRLNPIVEEEVEDGTESETELDQEIQNELRELENESSPTLKKD